MPEREREGRTDKNPFMCFCPGIDLEHNSSPALHLIKKRCAAAAPEGIQYVTRGGSEGEANSHCGLTRGIQREREMRGGDENTERQRVRLSTEMSRVETGLVALYT